MRRTKISELQRGLKLCYVAQYIHFTNIYNLISGLNKLTEKQRNLVLRFSVCLSIYRIYAFLDDSVGKLYSVQWPEI